MEMHLASTPFGSRPMTAALLAAQRNARQMPQDLAVDKWQMHRWLCEAKTIYGLNDRSLAVLSALLSFHPDNHLKANEGLIVFPSNKQLALRAHGMADATLRRHLGALVDAGFITRQDSPNGKRYARRAKGGELQIAFGFSLAPLLLRAEELETSAEQVRAEKAALREQRERLTLLRRDIAKLIEFAMTENLSGDWSAINQRFRAIVDTIPRRAERDELALLVAAMETLSVEINKLLNIQQNIENLSGNESQNERQQIESNPDSYFEKDSVSQIDQRRMITDKAQPEPTVSLDMVLRAYPEIEAYSSSPIRQWHGLMNAAETVRSFIGIDAKLYDLAKKTLGNYNTAIAIAYILQRYDQIRSAGGYLRILTEKAADSGFSIKPMMLAALNAQRRAQ
ncbi:plasmid replication protein RepC [Ochrobactrum teleogrylli]|uniref:Plasmid replication protein RepC n=1 Tax=Ochrobactrum teleogrylli TaxID=2479765 RepID=A0ABD5JST6_9HYPH